MFYMRYMRKDFPWGAFLIGIIAGGVFLQVFGGGTTNSEKASTLISELRKARSVAIMFFNSNRDLTLTDLLSIWPTLNAGVTSFDQYMDNPDRVRQLVFAAVSNVSPDNKTWLMVGKQVSDPIVADKMIGMAGGALYNAAGGAFTRDDSVVYMRVR